MSCVHWILLQAHPATSEGQAEAHGGSGESMPELQNIVTWLSEWLHQPWLEEWIDVIFSFAIMLIIFAFFASVGIRMKRELARMETQGQEKDSRGLDMMKKPQGMQLFAEAVVGGLEGFVVGILGRKGRKYTPLIGTLFIYILVMNLNGIVPIFGHSPTSSLNITLSLAIFVFLTVQIHGIRELGVLGYIKHFADLPERPTAVQWALVPLMFPLHIIGELAKPVSLSLRLFGNITGEDALIAIFVMLVAYVPLQLFMYPIVLIGSTIQALVFASLSTVYILMMSPHEESH